VRGGRRVGSVQRLRHGVVCAERTGGGEKTHLVFDGDAPHPICISRPNLPKW
jgi:hypothetical protein